MRGIVHRFTANPCALVALVLAVALVALASGCSGSSHRDLIVYEGASPAGTNVYTIDPGSGAIRQLTHDATFSGNPAWSVDRERIIFSSNRDGQPQDDLYTMDSEGGAVRRLTDTPDAGEFSAKYSPDGRSIAYVRQSTDGWTVWRMDSDGSDQREVAGPYAFAEFPAWTHDGREVYYSAMAKQGADDGSYGGADIYSADVSSGTTRVRISTPGGDVCPHFSRDGKRLTYAAVGAGGQLDIFAHDVSSDDTSGAHDVQLTHDPARDDYANPSPDDRTMVFVSDRNGKPELYLMDRDGGHERRLTTTPDVQENVPDW